MREATLQRFIRQPLFADLLAMERAEATSTDGNLAYFEFAQSRYIEMLEVSDRDHAKLVSGEDLIQLGFQPGPQFSAILRAIEDLAFEGKVTTKDQALEFVVKHFVE
jgi:poly(A) polymerase